MKKSISVNKKSRGRPKKAGGVDPVSAVRLSADVTKQVDLWGEKRKMSRSEAIRRLVETALKNQQPSTPIVRPGRRSRAQELAKDAINHMADPGASPGEQAERRRRLTKGPPEFREDRLDLPNVKGK
jgi:hypothetical protein